MGRKNKFFCQKRLWLCLLLMPIKLLAQEATDTTTLPFDAYLEQVLHHHPVAFQIELSQEQAEWSLKSARGGFDPVLSANFAGKDYDNKTYYQKNNYAVKLPTVAGATVEAGWDQNEGDFLNPEANTTSEGLWYIGGNIALGEGLITDERRTLLKRAKALREASLQERQLALADLEYQAIQAYWQWWSANAKLQIADNSVDVARERLRAVKQAFYRGDRPAVDTLEASIAADNRLQDRNNAQQSLVKARNALNTFLWSDGITPLIMRREVRPEKATDAMTSQVPLELLSQPGIAEHPKMLLIDQKRQALKWELRWKGEQIKPKIDLKWRWLSPGNQAPAHTAWSDENYQWGIAFKTPLLMRKERAEMKRAYTRVQWMEWEKLRVEREIQQKLVAQRAIIDAFRDQLQRQKGMVDKYKRLLEAEQKRFALGDSQLFLVNRREVNFLESQIKRVDLEADLMMAYAELQRLLGYTSKKDLP